MTKCALCRKKIMIGMEYQCLCKFIFCLNRICKLPEEHKCKYDWEEKGKKDIEKTMIKVKADKISGEKI